MPVDRQDTSARTVGVVIFASVLFFSGISPKFSPRIQMVLVGIAIVTFTAAMIYITGLPSY